MTLIKFSSKKMRDGIAILYCEDRIGEPCKLEETIEREEDIYALDDSAVEVHMLYDNGRDCLMGLKDFLHRYNAKILKIIEV